MGKKEKDKAPSEVVSVEPLPEGVPLLAESLTLKEDEAHKEEAEVPKEPKSVTFPVEGFVNAYASFT